MRPRSTAKLSFARATEAENRLLRIALCCFTETVGCAVLRLVRPHLSEPELLALNHRHMSDELQHSRVGWGYLATLNGAQKSQLSRRLGELLQILQRICCTGDERDDEALIAFGYFTPRLLRTAHDEALRDRFCPDFLT